MRIWKFRKCFGIRSRSAGILEDLKVDFVVGWINFFWGSFHGYYFCKGHRFFVDDFVNKCWLGLSGENELKIIQKQKCIIALNSRQASTLNWYRLCRIRLFRIRLWHFLGEIPIPGLKFRLIISWLQLKASDSVFLTTLHADIRLNMRKLSISDAWLYIIVHLCEYVRSTYITVENKDIFEICGLQVSLQNKFKRILNLLTKNWKTVPFDFPMYMYKRKKIEYFIGKL